MFAISLEVLTDEYGTIYRVERQERLVEVLSCRRDTG